MDTLLLFGVIVIVVGAVGVALGMLLAPCLSRWAERDDEEGPQA